MKSRWIVNLVMLLLVMAISAFIYFKPAKELDKPLEHELSTFKLSEFNKISIEFPAKAAVSYEKKNGFWFMTAPYSQRADQVATQRILSILAAKSVDKFSADDLSRFGLDHPTLKLKLNDQAFLFGTHNPVTQQQYVYHKNAVYLLDSYYEELASIQSIEMLDKRLFMKTQKIVGLDFSRLEQWEATGLELLLEKDQWKISVAKAKPNQSEIKEWFESLWGDPTALSLETYTPDRKASYPSFTIKLQDGSKIHVDKMQESPELLLARPDEGLIYHFPPDVGFSMLNPPANISQ